MTRTWLVTGAARGIGREIALAALRNGMRVVATARDPRKLSEAFPEAGDSLLAVKLDVTRPEQAEAAVALAREQFGGVDILVNNAGFGQLGHLETVDHPSIVRQFDTNVYGLIHVTRAVLPIMRQQRRGHIFNLSSIGGTLGFDGAAIYCATKFAVEGLSESLALELERFGIGVTIVEPGFFRTDFLDSSSVRYGEKMIPEYSDAAAQQRAQYDAYSHSQPGDPAKLGELIVEVANSPSPPLRLVAGSDALEMSRSLLDKRQTELESWADRAVSTDYLGK
ncbi:MAG: oxidoreductase [Acidobacteriota bacterium]